MGGINAAKNEVDDIMAKGRLEKTKEKKHSKEEVRVLNANLREIISFK